MMLTFPHGESQEGSPGFDAFQSAKSVTLCFSFCLSSEILSSPEESKTGNKWQEYIIEPLFINLQAFILSKTATYYFLFQKLNKGENLQSVAWTGNKEVYLTSLSYFI